MIKPKYLSETDAQRYTSLSRSTLVNARSDGKLTYRKLGGKILYTEADLDSYILRNSQLRMCTEDRIFVSKIKGAR